MNETGWNEIEQRQETFELRVRDLLLTPRYEEFRNSFNLFDFFQYEILPLREARFIRLNPPLDENLVNDVQALFNRVFDQ